MDSILNAIQSGIFWLLLKIDAIVYTFIDWIYQVILMLANGNILNDTNLVDEVINRVYIIIGVVILFLVAYSLLRSMINPDEALKGKESPVKIIQNVIISVVLIAIVPYIFGFAMQFQTSILQQNTIGRLILGEGNGQNSSSQTIDDGGFNIAINVFQAFFQPNTSMGFCTGNDSIDQNYPDCEPLEESIGGYNNYNDWWENEVIANKNLFAIADASGLVAANQISYTFIISTIAGAFVVLVLVSYCIDIAIRLVKLAVFQLIAPLPILARIVPKEDTKKIFSNWLKATISTYLEVFIRLGILFFAVFIIDLVVSNFDTIFNIAGENWGNINPILLLIAQALVILGIILFVKQLPQMIKDITGLDSGKYNVFGSALQAASMLGGGVLTAARNWNDRENIQGKNALTRGFNRVRSSLGGAGSAAFRSMMNRDNVKDVKSMRANARDSANKAFQAHQERIAYAKSHPNGVLKGHLQDQWDKIQFSLHGDVDDRRLQSIVDMSGKVGKGANDSIEDLLSMINGTAKEQKRQLDALKTKNVEISDYFDSVLIDGQMQYVAKGTNTNDPDLRSKVVSADRARQIAQEANTNLYKSAKAEFENTYTKAISTLYTVDLDDKNANIQEQKALWGLEKLSDDEARAQLQSFKNQITSRLNTLSLDQSIAKQTDASFNALRSLNVNDIVEQLAQNEAAQLQKNGISFNIADLRAKYSTDTDAIAKQLKNNIDYNKSVAGEIQRDAEFKTAEAKARNIKINSEKKD